MIRIQVACQIDDDGDKKSRTRGLERGGILAGKGFKFNESSEPPSGRTSTLPNRLVLHSPSCQQMGELTWDWLRAFLLQVVPC